MKWRFAVVFVVLVSLRAIDLFFTYQITPDLSIEWNPLVSYFNLSWPGFVGVQMLLVLFGMFGYYRYTTRVRNSVDKPGLSLPAFVYYYFNGHDMTWKSWTGSFVRMPNKRYFKQSSAFVGFVIFSSFMSVSVFAIFHNALILNETRAYLEFLVAHSELYFPAVFALLVVISANTFFLMEYFRYKKSMQSI